ncbi:MAG: hypothetical protein KatS3mg003_0718 [Candidatus Nitrosocaldaceae archaeon]|nr:MAG: hypothetical protein KatS3mg003_0718 [Candidatus Nitrosocaldaceae archaeon]
MYLKKLFNIFKPKDELMKLVDDIEDILGFIDPKVIILLYIIKRISNCIKGRESIECIEDEEYYTLCYDKYKFYYPKQYLWDDIIKDIDNMSYNLTYATNKIIELNNLSAYKIDYTKFEKDKKSREILKRIVDIVDEDGNELRKILKYMHKTYDVVIVCCLLK